ncbi:MULTISPECIES: hypothetical protein [unclassified Streptomyces]|uniref:hypothetical protein n=1 Tax=unclassified Streptomyces TaxID=2593676 RepID=UPI00332923F6
MPSPIARQITRSPWQAGPEAHTPGPVLVSVTEFTAHRHTQTAPIALAGLRLRRTWSGTPGAVGMWLWADPWHKRSGSVSFWIDERSMYAFVGRPDHVRIVRAHRDRGTMRATAWTADRLDTDAAWVVAHPLLVDPAAWPGPAVHAKEGP